MKKNKILLSMGIATSILVPTATLISCGPASNAPGTPGSNKDQEKMNTISKDQVTKAINDQLNPNSSIPASKTTPPINQSEFKRSY